MEKIAKYVQVFDGSGDINSWLEKLKMVADLQGVTQLKIAIPLLLGGSALAVYQELSTAQKDDVPELKRALLAAFSIDPFTAYRRFIERRWMVGESPDVFLADLRRLARLGQMESDGLVRNAFVEGLQKHVSIALKSAVKMDGIELRDLSERARVLMPVHELSDSSDMSAVALDCPDRRAKVKTQSCFKCGKIGHRIARCPEMTCFKCGRKGHMASSCLNAGNEDGKSQALTISRTE